MNCKKFEKNAVLWLRKKIKESGRKGIVIGLSGGIDSSVVAVLCKKAVSKKNLLCLILPCETLKEDINDVKSFTKKFNLVTKSIDLTGIYRNLMRILPSGDKISKGNLKPRLRMLTLYYFANKLNYLVAGTGNKSELSIGYFTKYGDGGTDILPIGNLYKSEVRNLADYLKIPGEIIKKAPSAGLWKGQTDEGEIGISYNKLDYCLKNKKLNKKLKKLTKSATHKLFPPEIFIT